ncbi:hypothetical protein ABL78_7729 [Leptomonas seymouri]|uniref:Uncharacterized protein n=1 Tax=Leptomonas seymouri TaxID=5684 RepID=A0A0N0P2Q8_LEPSE|nr:hypothetical protein ABL78_7729 [Leptomonas seymouri]|eukprot:KPI83239.1 hypothetical protein ABL78_7729 [Leptomonas seymouri]
MPVEDVQESRRYRAVLKPLRRSAGREVSVSSASVLSDGAGNDGALDIPSRRFIFSGDVAQWWVDEEAAGVGSYYNPYRCVLPRENAAALKWRSRPFQELLSMDRSRVDDHSNVGASVVRNPGAPMGVPLWNAATTSTPQRPPAAPSVVSDLEQRLTEHLGGSTMTATVLPPREQLRARRLWKQGGANEATVPRAEPRNLEREHGPMTRGRGDGRRQSADTHDALAFLRYGISEADVLAESRRSRFECQPSRPATASSAARVARHTAPVLSTSQSPSWGCANGIRRFQRTTAAAPITEVVGEAPRAGSADVLRRSDAKAQRGE